MSPDQLRSILHRSEGETLDFKRDQYPFYDPLAEENKRAELLKDILAFANAWKDAEAHIVIGVEEEHGRAKAIVGAEPPLRDNDIQQFVNAKTNRPVTFTVEVLPHEGVNLTVIRIEREQARPIYLRKTFARLQKGVVYVRRGSCTEEASPDEIADMGREEVRQTIPSERLPEIVLEFEHSIETRWLNTIVGYRDESRPFTVHLLRVKARNDGSDLAQHVRARVELPREILWDYMPEIAKQEGTFEKDPITWDLTNRLADPAPHIMAPRPPEYWRPLHPGSMLQLTAEKLLPIDEFLMDPRCIIKWEAQADAGIIRSGTLLFSTIPRSDRRKVKDAKLG